MHDEQIWAHAATAWLINNGDILPSQHSMMNSSFPEHASCSLSLQKLRPTFRIYAQLLTMHTNVT
jgi:hypothetical protein